MRTKIFWVIPAVFFLGGCSTVFNGNSKLADLETKVSILETKINSMEQRQSAVEAQTGASRESMGYLKGKVDARVPSTVVVASTPGNPGYSYQSGKKSLSSKEIQRALKQAGFYDGPVDGKIGKNTKSAIKRFQKANGLKGTGNVGSDTKRLLAQYLTAP